MQRRDQHSPAHDKLSEIVRKAPELLQCCLVTWCWPVLHNGDFSGIHMQSLGPNYILHILHTLHSIYMNSTTLKLITPCGMIYVQLYNDEVNIMSLCLLADLHLLLLHLCIILACKLRFACKALEWKRANVRRPAAVLHCTMLQLGNPDVFEDVCSTLAACDSAAITAMCLSYKMKQR